MKYSRNKSVRLLVRLGQLTHEWAQTNDQVKAQLKAYSEEQGCKMLLRRESFEAMLRAVPPEPGSSASSPGARPDIAGARHWPTQSTPSTAKP